MPGEHKVRPYVPVCSLPFPDSGFQVFHRYFLVAIYAEPRPAGLLYLRRRSIHKFVYHVEAEGEFHITVTVGNQNTCLKRVPFRCYNSHRNRYFLSMRLNDFMGYKRILPDNPQEPVDFRSTRFRSRKYHYFFPAIVGLFYNLKHPAIMECI